MEAAFVYIVISTVRGSVSSCRAYEHRASADFAVKALVREHRMVRPSEGIWMWQTPMGGKRIRMFHCAIEP